MNWDEIIAASDTIEAVSGGFTQSKRGIISLPSGQRLFVKVAVDSQSEAWLRQEIRAYEWLESQDYPYAPRMIARSETGFALPDFSGLDWSNTWDDHKLNAAFRAMDQLATLSDNALSEFPNANLGDNPWSKVPIGAGAYETVAAQDSSLLSRTARLLQDTIARAAYTRLAETNPLRGKQLIHLDVRADNFAYDKRRDNGFLVDWNWLSLGTKAFDQTAFLVDVYKSGYDVVENCRDRLDVASLAWLMGYWLAEVAKNPASKRSEKLRYYQLQSAVRADDIIRRLATD